MSSYKFLLYVNASYLWMYVHTCFIFMLFLSLPVLLLI